MRRDDLQPLKSKMNHTKKISFVCAAVGLLSTSSNATANAIGAFLSITVETPSRREEIGVSGSDSDSGGDVERYLFDAILNQDQKTYSIEVGGIESEFGEFGISNVSALLDPDPLIAYGLAVVDFGAPSTFTFAFSTPIVATGPMTTVRGEVGYTLTAGTDGSISLTPTAAKTAVYEVGGPLTSMGVDVGDPYGPGPSATPGTFIDGFKPGPMGLWTSLSATVSFTGSGGGDIYGITGKGEIYSVSKPVPDAGSGWAGLVLGGLALVSAARYRKIAV